MYSRALAMAVLLLLGGAQFAPLAAQSLAEAARREETRRKAIQQPATVITNKDLHSVPAPTPPPAATAAPADVSKDADTGADKGDKGAATKDADAAAARDAKDAGGAVTKDAKGQKGQMYWSDRLKTLQTQFERDQAFAEALQTRINALTTDFINRDNPVQRTAIERDRQKALAELGRLTKAIQTDKKALADLQEEARRAGVPPGWLR